MVGVRIRKISYMKYGWSSGTKNQLIKYWWSSDTKNQLIKYGWSSNKKNQLIKYGWSSDTKNRLIKYGWSSDIKIISYINMGGVWLKNKIFKDCTAITFQEFNLY